MYAKVVGPTLKARLDELAALPPDERHALGDEIDLARTSAEQALRLFDAAHHPPVGVKVDADTKYQAQKALQHALTFVSEIVSRAAKVRQINVGTVDVEQLAYITDAITRIIEEEIADKDHEMADRVIQRMRDIKMPERKGGINDPEELAQKLRDAASVIDAGIAAVDPEEER